MFPLSSACCMRCKWRFARVKAPWSSMIASNMYATVDVAWPRNSNPFQDIEDSRSFSTRSTLRFGQVWRAKLQKIQGTAVHTRRRICTKRCQKEVVGEMEGQLSDPLTSHFVAYCPSHTPKLFVCILRPKPIYRHRKHVQGHLRVTLVPHAQAIEPKVKSCRSRQGSGACQQWQNNTQWKWIKIHGATCYPSHSEWIPIQATEHEQLVVLPPL